MPRDTARDVRLSDEQIGLIIEGLDFVRLDQRAILTADDDAGPEPRLIKRALTKETEATRLQKRLARRLEIRGRGHTGNYAEKL